ncbi:unnamed protein product, partial [Prorocentrum cordatum]
DGHWDTTVYDKVNATTLQRTRCGVWADLAIKIDEGFWGALLATPPALTFHRYARLRGPGGTDIFGVRGLKPNESQSVREETLLANPAAEAARRFDRRGRPRLVGVPEPRQGVSTFLLPAFRSLEALASVCDCSVAPRSPGLFDGAPAIFRGNFALSFERDFDDLMRHLRSAFLAELDRVDSIPRPAQAGSRPDERASPTCLQREVRFTNPFRRIAENPKEQKRKEDARSFGGLRDAAGAVRRMPGHRVIGLALAHLMSVSWTSSQALGTNDVGPARSETCPTELCGGLLLQWGLRARDPRSHVAHWCWDGAPAGVAADPVLDELFPAADGDGDEVLTPDDLVEPAEDFVNFPGFEDDQEAAEQAVRDYLQAEPILSRFGVIRKVKDGKTKSRVILGPRASKVTYATRRTHRVALPRVTDLVSDLLDLMSSRGFGDDIELLILDFVDAFRNVPLRFDERRHFVGRVKGECLVFFRAAQVSRNSPLSWAAAASLAIRCAQSVFAPAPSAVGRGLEHARTQTFVNDPAISVRGSAEDRARRMSMIVLAWRVLGFHLAFHKAHQGVLVPWFGCVVTVGSTNSLVRVDKAKIDDCRAFVLECLRTNVVSAKRLRSALGSLARVASLVFIMRPFLNQMWGALAGSSPGAPPGCIWTAQFKRPLMWLHAFFDMEIGDLVRVFYLGAYLGTCPKIRIVTDASPWGFGGFIVIEGVFVSWFAAELPPDLAKVVGVEIGSCTGQQTLEADQPCNFRPRDRVCSVGFACVEKNDPTAQGRQRMWECLCKADGGPHPCPYHLFVTHFERLREHFGQLHAGLPVFPTSSGNVIAKAAMARSIEEVASKLGPPMRDDLGRPRFGGHALRVTGARWLASLGLPLVSIQLLARWLSETVRRYISEAPFRRLSVDYMAAAGGMHL